MYRILGLILVVLLSLCPMVASEENDVSESGNQDTVIERVGPEFFFDCVEEASRPQIIPPGRMHNSYEVRPDLPSGDVVKHLGCILQNPNNFNITVELSVSSEVNIWSPDEYCVESYSYRYDYQDREWGYYPDTYCNYGQWVISSELGMQNNTIELSNNETLYPHLSIYADSYFNPIQSGWQEINLTTRITKTQWYGDNQTSCINCSAINYTSFHLLNEWSNIEIDSRLACANNWGYISANQIDEIVELCDQDMFDAFNQLYLAEFIDVNCNSQMMYTNFNYNMYGQRNTNCEFTVDSFWGMLYNSTKLEQAELLADHEDEYGYYGYGHHHFQDYLDEKREYPDNEINYWGVKECPEQFPVAYTFDVLGNSNMTKHGEIQLISHHHNFDGHSTSYNIHNHTFEISSKNSTNFVSKIPLAQSEEEGDFLVVLESRIIIENESYERTILGSCLTKSGADSLDEIYEDSALTMGITGGPLQRFSNSIAFTIGVDSFVVVGFFSMCIPPILYLVLTRLVKRVNEEF